MKKFACSILYLYQHGPTEAHGHKAMVVEAEYAYQAEVIAEDMFLAGLSVAGSYQVLDVAVVEIEGVV